MVNFQALSLRPAVVREIQDISRKASAKEGRTVTLSEVVSVGLTHARFVFHLNDDIETDQ